MEYIAQIRKALVPVFVAGALAALAQFGVVETMSVGEAVTAISTSLLVYFIPNKR